MPFIFMPNERLHFGIKMKGIKMGRGSFSVEIGLGQGRFLPNKNLHSFLSGGFFQMMFVPCYTPSLPIASTGQPSMASLQRAASASFSGCL